MKQNTESYKFSSQIFWSALSVKLVVRWEWTNILLNSVEMACRGGGTFGDMDTSSDAGTLSYHADNFLINMFHFSNLIL